MEQVEKGLPARGSSAHFRARTRFNPKVALLKFYPSMPGPLIGAVRRQGAKGLVIEGTGLGHVNAECIRSVKEFVSAGGLVSMTSQCINGRVNLNVYDTGRDLLDAGVIPLEDMLAETALVKTMWVLGNYRNLEQARRALRKNLVGEMTERTFPE